MLEIISDASADTYRFWVRGEYLLWWVKGAPMPPLVTTGTQADAFPGALGQASTQVLFGGSNANYGAASGFRFSLGSWQDPDQTIGLEGSGFLLERKSTGFNAGSDASGNPPLYVPIFRADLGREGVYRIADPVVGINGNVGIAAQMRLWGAEANGVLNIWRRNGMSLDALGGFRYMDLAESLSVNASVTDFINQINDITVDRFGTRNQFYGGQFGARLGFQSGRTSFDLTGKLAMGANHETVEINGNTTQNGLGSGNSGAFPGGVLTQPSNIGRATQSQFGVIPEVQLRVGYQVLTNLRASVGYDFVYWNQVVRPGNQIDRNINPTQTLGGTLAGQTAPTFSVQPFGFLGAGRDLRPGTALLTIAWMQEMPVLVWRLRKNTKSFGFATDLWTAPRLAQVIQRKFGIDFHPRFLNQWLAEHKITPQKPQRRARERNDEAFERVHAIRYNQKRLLSFFDAADLPFPTRALAS